MNVVSKYRAAIKRTIVSGSALALLVVPLTPAIPAVLGHADSGSAYETLSSFSGNPGVSLTVSGGNFAPSEVINIVASQNGQSVASANTTANQYGEFSGSLQLPTKLSQGNVSIVASGVSSGLTATNGYYDVPFSPTLSTADGQTTPYSTISVSGSGYAPNETVDLNFAGSTTATQADASGSFSKVTVKTPNVPAASYTVIGAGEASGASATAYEYINGFYPSASPSSYYVMPATSLGFNGSGFAANETVDVTNAADGSAVSRFTTDATGSFKDAGSFTVPSSYAGTTQKFVLTGETSQATTTTSTAIGKYYPNVSPTAYYVMPGGTESFNGSGFMPGETVDITSGTTKIGSAVADKYGNLTAAVPTVIPSTEAGTDQTFTLTGETTMGIGSVTIQVGNYNPQASPSSYYVMPGTVVTFSGTGYAPNEIVTIFSGMNNIGTFSTDDTGSFAVQGSAMVAYNQANSSVNYQLVGSASKQPISFTIGVGQLNAMISPSSYYVLPYAPFNVTATGFAPNEKVNLNNGTTLLGTATTDAMGKAVFKNISLPYAANVSSVNLTATGVTSQATATASIGIGSYNATVVADNYYAKPGSTVNLSGTGFAPNETVDITGPGLSTTAVADDEGNFMSNAVLPFGQSTTSYSITSTGEMSHATSTTTVTLAPYYVNVSPSTYYAQPGTAVSFTGSGFLPNEPITVSLNGKLVGNETADTMGNLTSTGTYTLPFGKTAAFTVTGTTSGATSTMNIGLAQFYAGVQLSSYYGNGGSVVTASGSGFAPNETVTLMSGTTTLATTQADATGAFSKAITIPYAAPGKLDITATGSQSSASATTNYTVAQVYNSVGMGSYVVPAGQAVNITGSGFFPGEPVTVTTDRTSGTYTFKADANGNLNDSGFVLPANLAAGNLTLTIDGTYSYTSHAITIYVQN